MLDFIHWTVDPVLFSFGPLSVRWYGLMWAIGFLVGYWIVTKVYEREGIAEEISEKVFMYMLIGTVIGARIGHCFFYDFAYYSKHLAEVLYVWQGGLSSHGGACGIIIALLIFSKKVIHKNFIWVMDRIVLSVAICGACIRFGNLMNHEIYGHPTDFHGHSSSSPIFTNGRQEQNQSSPRQVIRPRSMSRSTVSLRSPS